MWIDYARPIMLLVLLPEVCPQGGTLRKWVEILSVSITSTNYIWVVFREFLNLEYSKIKKPRWISIIPGIRSICEKLKNHGIRPKYNKSSEFSLYLVYTWNIILDILNPTLYHKVKSIEIELGASDDEDILDKSIKVQTALPSRKQ